MFGALEPRACFLFSTHEKFTDTPSAMQYEKYAYVDVNRLYR